MIQSLFVHKVGNKLNDEYLFLSQHPLEIDETLEAMLSQYFLTAFGEEEFYHFHHDMELALNEVYTCTQRIFESPEALKEQSEHLARHLFNQSTHPKIKGGEFYVVYFKDHIFRGETLDAIGLFKTENKDTYLDIKQNGNDFLAESKEGINLRKLDKGCLIYQTEPENGYILSIVDNTNKGSEAQYWKDDFLKVLILNNGFHQTHQFLGLTKQFVTQQLEEEFEVSKTDKIDLLNRSVDYFKNKGQFNKEEFETEVFGDTAVIDSFRKFDENFRQENEAAISDQFDISTAAVKKQARSFKSVLKLDKNFHIYIHGNREMIEQGRDENGRKFYKIYYETEA